MSAKQKTHGAEFKPKIRDGLNILDNLQIKKY